VSRSAALVFALAAAFVFAGCGEKRHTSSSGSASGGTAATISESEFKLSPSAASAAAGSTITVKNAGTITHALVIKLPSNDIRTRSLAPGDSVQVKAPGKAGSYQMYCPIDGHRKNGMKGTLKVTGSSSSAPSPSPAPSQSPGGY
jgi:plastocyanin